VERGGVNRDFFLAGNFRQMLRDERARDPAQIKPLAAGENRRQDVVANMNFTCAGGSSRVLSSALNAAVESMWTSSMM
jgi:hypothetical protein